jgi:hypothetical protein
MRSARTVGAASSAWTRAFTVIVMNLSSDKRRDRSAQMDISGGHAAPTSKLGRCNGGEYVANREPVPGCGAEVVYSAPSQRQAFS